MKELKITEDAAKKAYSEAKAPGKLLLENLFGKKTFLTSIEDRIKNFDDVLSEVGKTRKNFEESCKGLEPDEIAYRMAKLVCIVFNDGWVPDWANSNEYKYSVCFRMSSSSGVGFSYIVYARWNSFSNVGSHLCFKSRELAVYAAKTFEQEIYKPLLTI